LLDVLESVRLVVEVDLGCHIVRDVVSLVSHCYVSCNAAVVLKERTVDLCLYLIRIDETAFGPSEDVLFEFAVGDIKAQELWDQGILSSHILYLDK
jgi:hypothetical protein